MIGDEFVQQHFEFLKDGVAIAVCDQVGERAGQEQTLVTRVQVGPRLPKPDHRTSGLRFAAAASHKKEAAKSAFLVGFGEQCSNGLREFLKLARKDREAPLASVHEYPVPLAEICRSKSGHLRLVGAFSPVLLPSF